MWFLSLYLLYLSYFQIALAQVNNKIIGGTTTTINQHTYVVSLYVGGYFTCGGSLINPYFVVTAAHCVSGRTSDNVRVRGGRTYLSGTGGVSSAVARIILPKQYNSNTMDMDIAVLKLETPFTTIPPIKLYTDDVSAGATVTALGWGYTSEGGSVSNQLRKVDVTVVSQDSCQSSYRNQAALTNTMMCASKQGKDSCNGDSGGPLIYQSKLIGIVSWGVGCAENQYPGVYTRTSTCQSFINAALAL